MLFFNILKDLTESLLNESEDYNAQITIRKLSDSNFISLPRRLLLLHLEESTQVFHQHLQQKESFLRS